MKTFKSKLLFRFFSIYTCKVANIPDLLGPLHTYNMSHRHRGDLKNNISWKEHISGNLFFDGE